MSVDNLIFRQLFENETSTYTYLVGDPDTKEAVIIDPVIETVERDLRLIEELGLKLVYVLDTHIHADHATGAGEIRRRTRAKTAVGAGAGVQCADLLLSDGQELLVGRIKIKAFATPGHTDSCMSYLIGNHIFTGDALLIRGNGRTDFQQGSSERLFKSITEKLFKLPPETLVYPAHDYRGHTSTTIKEEMKWNPRIHSGTDLSEFVKTMSELKLANPAKIHEAVPANLSCGQLAKTTNKSRALTPLLVDGRPDVTPQEVRTHLSKLRVIDVRGPDEFSGELGHIEGAELVPLGKDLSAFLQNGDRSQEIVFVCGSGGRSGTATYLGLQLGYSLSANMAGGMIAWNELGFPVSRRRTVKEHRT